MAAPAPGSPASPTPSAPWFAGPLFHLVTAVVAIASGLLWLKFGGDPAVAIGAFGAGVAFLGVGGGSAAAAAASGP